MFIVVVERTTPDAGIQVDPGTSQFRRLWATSTEKMMSTNMTRPDLSHSCRLERSRPNPAPKGAPHGIREIGPIFLAQGPDHEMSAMGHEQTSRHVRVMSVIPLKADIHQRELNVRYVHISGHWLSTTYRTVDGLEAE